MSVSLMRVLIAGTLLLFTGSGKGPLAAEPRVPARHEVRLAAGAFVPKETRAAVGDTIHFVAGYGTPHNVQFMAESIPRTAQTIIDAAMKGRVAPLTSPMLLAAFETWDFVVPQLAAGRYAFLCSPHWSTMRGGLTVVR